MIMYLGQGSHVWKEFLTLSCIPHRFTAHSQHRPYLPECHPLHSHPESLLNLIAENPLAVALTYAPLTLSGH